MKRMPYKGKNRREKKVTHVGEHVVQQTNSEKYDLYFKR